MMVQDTIYILTKMRTRFLNKKLSMKIGDYTVSSEHVRQIVEEKSKGEYGLCFSDLKAADKMHFKAAEKICSQRVISQLYDIDSSHATIIYLQTMQDVMTSYLDEKISPGQRGYLIWKSTFILRLWRNWLETRVKKKTVNPGKRGNKKRKKQPVMQFFLTSSCCSCIELDAH